MSRVITFSRVFPSYHPKKGEPTFFVEKIYKSLYLMKAVPKEIVEAFNFEIMNNDTVAPKHHTIRAGNRWKVGDKFSPRVWSGKPYQSKQITIASDVELKKVFSIKIETVEVMEKTFTKWIYINGKFYGTSITGTLAGNDGLKTFDFENWFNKNSFEGQILCWNENINY